MSEDQTTEENQESTEKVDKTQKVRDLWNDGKASGVKEATLTFEKTLAEKFGTSDLDEIHSQIAGKKQADNQSVVDAYELKIKELDNQLNSVRTQANQSLIKSSLSSEFSHLNPHKLSSVIRDFTAEHSVKVNEGRLSIKDINDAPIFGDNGEADIKTIIKNWSEKDENKIFFKTPVNNHIDSSPSNKEADMSKYSDPNYIKALKISGQYEKDLKGEKIDEKQVELVYQNLA